MNAGEARSAEKRRQILDAARDAFAANGFHAASMAEIAAKATMSVGHIYRYFENKEAVIVAMVEADLEQAAVEIASMPGDADGVASEIVAHIAAKSVPCNLALMLEILSEAARNPRVAAKVRAADVELRARLHEALQSRLAPTSHAELDGRIEVICVLIEGLMVRTIKTADGDRPAVARRVREILLQMLRG